jgi:plastocyanin
MRLTMRLTRSLRALALAGLLAPCLLLPLARGSAATVTATVTDDSGSAMPDAVVMIAPEAGAPTPPLEGSSLATAVIDQKDEMFVPYVVVIRTGGTIAFHNSDSLRHHVYSFSRIRQFELVMALGETSVPIRFDKPGVAAIGCNIHDQMIAYVYVTDAPWAAVTDAAGKAVITGVPPGTYTATAWHPDTRPAPQRPGVPVVLAPGSTSLAVTLSVAPSRHKRMSAH